MSAMYTVPVTYTHIYKREQRLMSETPKTTATMTNFTKNKISQKDSPFKRKILHLKERFPIKKKVSPFKRKIPLLFMLRTEDMTFLL